MPQVSREVSEQPGRDESAGDREREDPVVEARMVVGKAVPDLFHHQRIDGSKAAADKQNAHDGAELIVGGRQHDAFPSSAETMEPISSNAVAHALQQQLRNDAAHQQRRPIERQQQQRIRRD